MENPVPLRKSLGTGARKWRRLCLGVILYNPITTLGMIVSSFDITLPGLVCPLLPLVLPLGIFDASETGTWILMLSLTVLPLAGWLLFRLGKAWGAWLVYVCGSVLLGIACLLLFLGFFLLTVLGAFFLLQLGILFFVSIFMLVSMHIWSNATARANGDGSR